MQITDTRRIADIGPAQKVVIVNGNSTVMGMLEDVLDEGRYDMVFVESSDRAYSQIRSVGPNLVILCTGLDEVEAFQLLTMLKLDPKTKGIPVVTCTTGPDDEPHEEGCTCGYEDEDFLPARPALRLN